MSATAWGILTGILLGLCLARRYRVSLVPARSHVPGVMGMAIAMPIGLSLLFDLRGLIAEENVDAGTWPTGGVLFRATKWMERRLVGAGAGVVTLTAGVAQTVQCRYEREIAGKPLSINHRSGTGNAHNTILVSDVVSPAPAT